MNSVRGAAVVIVLLAAAACAFEGRVAAPADGASGLDDAAVDAVVVVPTDACVDECAVGATDCPGGLVGMLRTCEPTSLGCRRWVETPCGAGTMCTAGECAPIGCADGQREGFADLDLFDGIAACDGGFDVPGLAVGLSTSCDRAAGDDGVNPGGITCGAADLCASGWHVCASKEEVAARTVSGGCTGLAAQPDTFYATSESGGGSGSCSDGAVATNDLFGCGTRGSSPNGDCAPLDRFSSNGCSALGSPWSCSGSGTDELIVVTKPGTDRGGVLCCRDSAP